MVQCAGTSAVVQCPPSAYSFGWRSSPTRLDVSVHPEQVDRIVLAIRAITRVLGEVTFPGQPHRSRSNQPSA